MGRRRAVVLGLVQLLIILHVVLWLLSREYGWFGGETITPIEPIMPRDKRQTRMWLVRLAR